jgi:hypothetical protein
MSIPNKLYHGTCRAFVQLAKERDGKFGPDYDSIRFTPDKTHAQAFADSWQKPAGQKRLDEMFGDIPNELVQPVILEFDSRTLGKLNEGMDGGVVEYFIECGPVNLPKTN